MVLQLLILPKNGLKSTILLYTPHCLSGVGIKTVERDKFPIIFKDNSYPQIICIKSTKYNNLIFVCGLATSNVLNNYQDDDLILDPNLRARGTKTGFYGFEQLVPIKSLNDLSTYKK